MWLLHWLNDKALVSREPHNVLLDQGVVIWRLSRLKMRKVSTRGCRLQGKEDHHRVQKVAISGRDDGFSTTAHNNNKVSAGAGMG